MPAKRTTASGYEHAKILREETTPAESKLWIFLRRNNLNGVYFRRQHAIGKYVTDFCAPKAKLIIELDGSPHTENGEYDEERTKYLGKKGYKVIRFWNSRVITDIKGVLDDISDQMKP
jgi:very-short-patch-repair endonuclease